MLKAVVPPAVVRLTVVPVVPLLATQRPSVTVAFDFPKTDYPTANARYIIAYGATLARVAVSRITGMVRVLDLHQHSAAGPVMDVAAYLGQLEGGGVALEEGAGVDEVGGGPAQPAERGSNNRVEGMEPHTAKPDGNWMD